MFITLLTARGREILVGVLIGTLLALPSSSFAQAFSRRPITVIVPYAAGGTADLIARMVQVPLQKILGAPVVVEDKPGASGLIATRYVAHASPDGYTLLMQTSAIVITPQINRMAGVMPLKDLTPVAMVASEPFVLLTHPSLPVHSVKELIEYAKAHPNSIDYGSSGPDSYGRLATEMFMRQAGITMNQVPYKGVSEIVEALLTGQVKLMLSSATPETIQLAKQGKLNILGVASQQPYAKLQGVESIEKTLNGFHVENNYGLYAPIGTARDVVTKLHDALEQVVSNPGFGATLKSTLVTPRSMSQEEMKSWMQQEYSKWGAIITGARISAG